MKLSLDNAPYISRETGKPVEGRLKVYDNDTDVLSHVYTLEGDSYVPAMNPTLIHGGLIEDTLFLDLGLYTLKVQKYIGEEGQMSVDSPDSDFADDDQFKFGLDYDPNRMNDVLVDTVADLADVDPAVGMVTVKWYAEPGDCFPRTYVWDASSENDPDGGYVLASDVSDTGRWILMWDDEILPCTVYGVQPGSEANTSLLLDYPAVVGSFRLRTAPCVRFVSGNYTANVNYSTDKVIVFDDGAKFTKSVITCPKIISLGDGYHADFVFTGEGITAHSNWFRTVDRFWHCGADVFVVDVTNHFTDTKLKSMLDMQKKTVIGAETCVTEYVNGSYFKIFQTSNIPDRFFKRTDCVEVAMVNMGDRYFATTGVWDPGPISQGHHQQYSQAPALSMFDSADLWLAVMLERRARVTTWTKYDLDLEGRTIGSFTLPADSFNKLYNATVDGRLTMYGRVEFRNSKATVYCQGNVAQIQAYDSDITVADGSAMPRNLFARDSRILVEGQNGLDPMDTEISVVGGTFNSRIWLSNANADSYTAHKPVVIHDAILGGPYHWRVSAIEMVRCEGDVKIDFMPVKNTSDNIYYWNCDLFDNYFVGSSRLWFGIYATETNPHNDMANHCRYGSVKIVNNRFRGDALGIKQMHWHPYTLNGLLKDGSVWEYHGNSGRCPRLSPGFLINEGHWTGTHSSAVASWRIYDADFNLWCPYNYYDDGSVMVAHEPTGLNPNTQNTMYALVSTSDITSGLAHFFWAVQIKYRSTDIIADPWNENENNTFVCKVGLGYGLPVNPPEFDSGATYFPGLDVV